jgi:hypothetical protein
MLGRDTMNVLLLFVQGLVRDPMGFLGSVNDIRDFFSCLTTV